MTGSLLKRIEAESALPIIVLEENSHDGRDDFRTVVRRIAPIQGVRYGLGQATRREHRWSGEADLRGLGAEQDVDAGQRPPGRAARSTGNEGAIDVNWIPMNAIDRVEVLKDGASAVYGRMQSVASSTSSCGASTPGSSWPPKVSGRRSRAARNSRLTALAGWGNLGKDRWNIMGSLDYRKQDVLLATDRSFAKTGILGPTRDDILSGTSGTSFPGDVNGFEPSAPGCAPPALNTGYLIRPVQHSDLAATTSTQDIDIIPENDQLTGLLRGTLKLGQDHLVTGEYVWAEEHRYRRLRCGSGKFHYPCDASAFPCRRGRNTEGRPGR